MMYEYGPWPWMWIFPLSFLILILVFLFRVVGRKDRKEETAKEILDRRYANGDISREDYQRMKKDLE